MNGESTFQYRLTVKLVLILSIIVLVVLAREFLIPFLIAIFFTFLLLPLSKKLERWGIHRTAAIIISIVIAVIIFGGLLYFFYTQIISFVDQWPELEKALNKKMESIYHFVRENFNISKREQKNWVNMKLKETADSGDTIVFGLFSATAAFMAGFVLIPVYIFFLTYYREKFKTFILLIIKDKSESEQALMVMEKISNVSQKYLKGIFLDVAILSVLNSAGYLALGIQHAILFGVMSAILNIIPYVGTFAGTSLPVLMALLTKDEISIVFAVAGVGILVQFLDNNFITPYIVASSVSINPLTAIVVLVISALLWGIPGMILCIPLTGMIKVLCDNVEALKPYGYLIGEEVNYNGRKDSHRKFLKHFSSKTKS